MLIPVVNRTMLKPVKQRTTRLLLLVLALALMVSPLRTALAVPVLPDTQARPHCAMQHAPMQHEHGAAQAALSAAGKACPACKQDCPGERCAGHCATLMHLFIALTCDHAAARPEPAAVPLPVHSERISDCTTAPLFRPPILTI